MREKNYFFMYLNLIMITKDEKEGGLTNCSHSSILIKSFFVFFFFDLVIVKRKLFFSQSS